MSVKGKELYWCKGKLKVAAKGYWFTAGGEKGSFGFKPHLRDEDGYPVYPDTQVHGDLRMAALWLNELEGNNKWESMIEKVFGKMAMDTAAPFYVTDLELTEDAKNDWNERFFEVKSRIDIDDDRRIVTKHMLVSFQMAYLDKKNLESSLYLAYFDEEKSLNRAKDMLVQAVLLLSGFGAFRSRGYGRGDLQIEWEENQKVSADAPIPVNSEILYSLTCLVHFRNRTVLPGRTQLLSTQRWISAEQIRGWFVRTYEALYGDWPTHEEMRHIRFCNLYPALPVNRDIILAYPPPRTTMKDEHIFDAAGNGDPNDEHGDGFISSKPKPLHDKYFLTDEDDSRAFELQTGIRMRNAIDADFQTKEGGLFAQEYINRWTIFRGIVRLSDLQSKFCLRCGFILSKVKPTIAGTIFTPFVASFTSNKTIKEGKRYLVTSPLLFTEEFFTCSDNTLNVTTKWRYNTILKRPRRCRIAIAEGSVVHCGIHGKAIPWPGFGKERIEEITMNAMNAQRKKIGVQERGVNGELREKLGKISPSQAGQLRELLRPGLDAEYIKTLIKGYLQKYQDWKKDEIEERLIPDSLLKEALKVLEKSGDDMKAFRGYIQIMLQEIYWQRWNREIKGKAEKEFKKVAGDRGYEDK
jgi:CRISPR/Cas system CSM-associated protein Csm3 (group 7 of RAMP superfamily)